MLEINQRTISKPISFKGIGLHNGLKSQIKISPASEDHGIVFNEPYEERLIAASLGAAELIGKGWEKEAIPIIQSKKSIISRLFSSLFN